MRSSREYLFGALIGISFKMSNPTDSTPLPDSQRQEQDVDKQSETTPVEEGTEALLEVSQAQENPRLCDPFLEKFAGMMNHENMSCVLEEQKHMMSVLEVANEKLASVNRISERNYFDMSVDLRQSSRTLVTMKKDLDSVFRRIRSLKAQVAAQYPEAYSQVESQQTKSDSDEDG